MVICPCRKRCYGQNYEFVTNSQIIFKINSPTIPLLFKGSQLSVVFTGVHRLIDICDRRGVVNVAEKRGSGAHYWGGGTQACSVVELQFPWTIHFLGTSPVLCSAFYFLLNKYFLTFQYIAC